jgi:hypothetical protein
LIHDGPKHRVAMLLKRMAGEALVDPVVAGPLWFVVSPNRYQL